MIIPQQGMARLLRLEESIGVIEEPLTAWVRVFLSRRQRTVEARIHLHPLMVGDHGQLEEILSHMRASLDHMEFGIEPPEQRDEQRAVAPDAIPVLLEFAKAGKREDFEWLARSAGVKERELEELWRGTLARLGLDP